jgi:ubiquitin-protein ligase
MSRWVIEVGGAAGTLYAGETYQLQVDFPEHYPMEAPQVIFSSSFFRTNIAPQVSLLHN